METEHVGCQLIGDSFGFLSFMYLPHLRRPFEGDADNVEDTVDIAHISPYCPHLSRHV